MQSIGLTGGIACGKSTAMLLLSEMGQDQLRFFDADVAVAQHLKNPELIERIHDLFEIRSNDGQTLNKSELRQRIFNEAESRQLLENILHPLVREDCLASLQDAEQTHGVSHFIADIPLLFESSGSYPFDLTCVVACSRASQVKRLKYRSALDAELIEKILDAQWPIERKMLKADRVLWNEGPEKILKEQLKRLLGE